MMSQSYVYYVVALLCLNMGTVAGDDLTTKDNQKGEAVVEAVVDRIRSNCIFPSDHEFLRRLALVQSHNGEDQKTYSIPEYHGGIWQIDQDKYNIIRSCPGNMSATCDQINSTLNIDWRHTDWTDLRKPLYSGLAAALYTMYGYHSAIIPSNLHTQASIWQALFAPGQNSSRFTAIKPFSHNCSSMKLDLAFIIDDSESIIGYANFMKVLHFMTNVTADLPIGKDSTRIGVVTFAGLPYLTFDFKSYFTKIEIESAIMNIAYIGGSTGTAGGLDLARTQLFNSPAGSRKDATKVALLITGGYSNSYTSTSLAAKRLRDLGVAVFAIGVGNSFIDELNAVVTFPVCTHVYSINNFDDFHTILNAIQRGSCTAPLIVEQTGNGTNSSIPEIKTKIDIPKNNTDTGPVIAYPKTCNQTTITTEALCGVVELFASFETSHPGKALHQYSGVAIDGLPFTMKIKGDSACRPLYVSYQATSLLIEKCQNLTGHFTTTSISGEHPGNEDFYCFVCRRNGKESNCAMTEFQVGNYKEPLCPDPWGNVPNPCTPKLASQTGAKLFHPHPVDVTKFIKCDDLGEMYVTQCPPGKEYNDEVSKCEKKGVIKLPDNLNHLCIDNLRPGTHFYAHPTNKHQYLECDLSGHASVFDCPANHIWQQDGLSCIVDPLYTTNPCSSLAHTRGQNYFPLPDLKKYISCDIHNNMSINECPSNTHFSDVLQKCVGDAGIIG